MSDPNRMYKKLEVIDFLKGYAMLSIVIYHLGQIYFFDHPTLFYLSLSRPDQETG